MACGCNNVTVIAPAPCKDCLVAKSAIVPCDEMVQPCGGTFSVDLNDLIDTTICTGGFTIEVDTFDTTFLTNVAIDGANILTGEIVGGPGAQGIMPKVVYRVKCTNGFNSARGTVSVCVVNPCANIACPVGEACNGCTGACEPLPVNVVIQAP